MNKFHISQAHNRIGTHSNLPFWISMIEASQRVITPDTEKVVLDFGCGEGKFLPVFDLMDNLKTGVGIEIDDKLLISAQQNSTNNISYAHYNEFANYHDYFDVAYSQEVLYTLPDLKKHAEEMFLCLKKGGYYFATMGSHIQNPLWAHRRDIIRREETYPVCDYSLEEVANIFFDAGFEVGLKRLPVEYFIIYHPEMTKSFSKSYLDLVNSIYEHKMLFLFWKEE
ncbi:MAG: class I SAM-dependent methyltransferase [Methylococcaceae bacterium]